jgi:hypothetical protein
MDKASIKAMGIGNKKIKKNNGKRIIRVICLPKIKRERPMIKNKIEKLEIEKI